MKMEVTEKRPCSSSKKTPPHCVVEIIASINKAERNKQKQQQHVPFAVQSGVKVAKMVKLYETATVPHTSKVATRATVTADSKKGSMTVPFEGKAREEPHQGQVTRLVEFFEQQTSMKEAKTFARSFAGGSSQPQ